MGWSFGHRPAGRSNRDWFASELGPGSELVDISSTPNVTYLALGTDRGVLGVVVLTRWVPQDHHNFGTKWMDEAMGPYEAGAPARILGALSPVEELFPNNPGAQQHARQWRERCAQRNRLREQLQVVKPGWWVELAEGLDFQDGVTRRRFQYLTRGTFRGEDGVRVRIPDWKSLPIASVSAP